MSIEMFCVEVFEFLISIAGNGDSALTTRLSPALLFCIPFTNPPVTVISAPFQL